jgi:hypothetical protein
MYSAEVMRLRWARPRRQLPAGTAGQITDRNSIAAGPASAVIATAEEGG